MDSALCLRYGPPVPSFPRSFKYPKVSATRVPTDLHLSFNPCPLSVSSRSILGRPRQTFGRHVVYALDRFSKPFKEDNQGDGASGLVRGTVGASLVLACVVAIMGCRGVAAPPKCLAVQRHVETGDVDAITVADAKKALRPLFAVYIKLATSAIYTKEKLQLSKFGKVSKMPSAAELADLQLEAVKLIKAGMGVEAEKRLRKVFENVKDKNADYLNESAYNVQMVLVEILIAQGKYKDASKCECLKKGPTIHGDKRYYLYKALTSTMLDAKESAKCWNDLTKVVREASVPNPMDTDT